MVAALAQVLAERGSIGFNAVILTETGEEAGSLGLREFCAAHAALFAADVFIASDGPRLAPAGGGKGRVFENLRLAGRINFTIVIRSGGERHTQTR